MIDSAKVLHCPNCGAVAEPGATLCTYCNATLATEVCPACFAKFFTGYSNCPYCGAEARAETPDSTGTQHCPKCESHPALKPMRLGETQVATCDRCAGFWLDNQTFTELQEKREAQTALLGMPSLGPAPQAAQAEPIRYVPCPGCKKLMNRVNFARCSGVIVDTCKHHGTWFDADELRRIILFIEEGGLTKGREREAERERERERLARSEIHEVTLEEKMNPSGYAGSSLTLSEVGELVSGLGSMIKRVI